MKYKKYFQNEPKFNGVYSRNIFSKIKDGASVINLVEYQIIGVQWRALYVNSENVTFFESFEVEHIPKGIKKYHNGNKI